MSGVVCVTKIAKILTPYMVLFPDGKWEARRVNKTLADFVNGPSNPQIKDSDLIW